MQTSCISSHLNILSELHQLYVQVHSNVLLNCGAISPEWHFHEMKQPTNQNKEKYKLLILMKYCSRTVLNTNREEGSQIEL